MPFTGNGFGTSLCGSRGDVGWGSHDGVEWLVAFYMPLVPLKSVHTFDWQGNQYRAIPIAPSFDLTARTFLGRWAWGMGILGAVLVLFTVIEFTSQRPMGLGFLFAFAAILLLGLAATLLVVLGWTDARNKAIRRVLGARLCLMNHPRGRAAGGSVGSSRALPLPGS